jgi:hypothetical protein
MDFCLRCDYCVGTETLLCVKIEGFPRQGLPLRSGRSDVRLAPGERKLIELNMGMRELQGRDAWNLVYRVISVEEIMKLYFLRPASPEAPIRS